MRKNFLGPVENFLWQTCQPRNLDAIAFVRTAGHDFAKENDLIVPLADCDIEIATAFAFRGEFGQVMILRGEEALRFDFVMKKLGDAPGDRESVECGGAATVLIEDHKGALGRLVT